MDIIILLPYHFIVTINFKLTSSQDSLVITFSLTCNSTGGPVSSVTWTRDGLLLENTGPLVQTDSATASYTNILRVSSRTPGTYTCHMRGMDNQVVGAMDFTVSGNDNTKCFLGRNIFCEFRCIW